MKKYILILALILTSVINVTAAWTISSVSRNNLSCSSPEFATYTYTVTYNVTPSSTVGISDNENNQEVELTLYPNPTTDIINIKSNEEINQIDVYSLGGMLVVSNTKETSINVSNLASGYYITHIHTNNTIVTKKFLKQ